METSQVEPRSQTRDAEQLLNTLPVHDPLSTKSVLDFITEERADDSIPGESRAARTILLAMSWSLYGLMVGALIWMTVATGMEYLAP